MSRYLRWISNVRVWVGRGGRGREGEGREGCHHGRKMGGGMWMPHCHIARLPQHLSSDPLLGRGCHNDAPLRITARHREYIG